MYGHGAVPPSRGSATVITLRVLFAVAGLLSCGLLACVPLFRVAYLRGRWYDWTAAWVSLPLSITALAVVGSVPESDARGDVAMAGVMLLGAASAAYFLTVDITLGGRRRPFAGPVPPPVAPAFQAPYGYPHPTPPASPYTSTFGSQGAPVFGPGAPTPVPQPQPDRIPQAPAQGPASAPQRPEPARIDQVRAELDELSNYLRNQDGHDGRSEGGR
ncbi:hypothetical protein [Streptomyces sp. NPDC053367]|uniref:hypothetical protein n=1 Tax=Streptomyces sp. NPDC053367 TaxID=3365700 RepID=UPI0037D226F4